MKLRDLYHNIRQAVFGKPITPPPLPDTRQAEEALEISISRAQKPSMIRNKAETKTRKVMKETLVSLPVDRDLDILGGVDRRWPNGQ